MEGGTLVGPYRQPRNLLQEIEGSIHNDNVARPLGFRGGTIGGVIHHEQFVPLLLKAFGQRWFEAGGLSIYYQNAVSDSERVRAYVQRPPRDANDVAVSVWMDHENGMRVLDGTALIGRPTEPSALRRRFASRPPSGELRILADLPMGEGMPEVTARIDTAAQYTRKSAITEPLAWPSHDSGHRVPAAKQGARAWQTHAPGSRALRSNRSERATWSHLGESRLQNPGGRLLATGATPKSDYLWWEATLRELGASDPVADCL